MNLQRLLLVLLLLAVGGGGWWFSRAERHPQSPIGEPAPTAQVPPEKKQPDLKALVDKAGANTRYADLKTALAEALGSGMTHSEQLDFIRRLKESGMDIVEWERTVRELLGASEDPAFLLELSGVLDAGGQKESVLNRAFKFVTKDNLPMFTKALETVQDDQHREILAGMVVDRILADGDLAFSAKWVDSVAGMKEKDRYASLMLNTLVQAIGLSPDGKPLLPFKELPGTFTEKQLWQYRPVYGGYYLSQGDYDSLPSVYAGLPVQERSSVISSSIAKAKGIPAAKAEELLALVPEDDEYRLMVTIDLARKIRAKDGEEAAAAFIKAHPEAEPKPRPNP